MESDLFDSYYLICNGSADRETFLLDVQLAIYLYCRHNVDGQFSDEYKICCYFNRQGWNVQSDEPSEFGLYIELMYETLNETYGNK